jgi:phage terminase large subunit-like protein
MNGTAGKPFLLAHWGEKVLFQIFGNVDEEGNRVIEMGYLELPQKSGKSEFAAGVALFLLVSTHTPGIFMNQVHRPRDLESSRCYS